LLYFLPSIYSRNNNVSLGPIALQSRPGVFGAPCTPYICSQTLTAASLRRGSSVFHDASGQNVPRQNATKIQSAVVLWPMNCRFVW